MQCENPINLKSMLARCGQCEPCRAARSREWAGRIMLEAGCHTSNVFLTLTYNDDHLPADGSLRPKDLQDWLKRARRALKHSRLRFFACGEYGSKTGRAHYHAVLFNAPSCIRGRSDKFRRGAGGTVCCPVCALYQKTWSLDGEEIGSVDVGMVEPRTASYIGGYIVKGKTHRLDHRLGGKEPEFSTKSLRPGLGAFAVDALAVAFLDAKRTVLDIPTYVEFGGAKYPLGRYLTKRFRKKVGIDDAVAQAIRSTYSQQTMSDLREMAEANSITLKEAYTAIHAQKIRNWKAKRKIRKRTDTL
jgi:hypothetical protein